MLDEIDPVTPDDDIVDLRRLLYGLHAILRLHFAQEDEGYLSLADDDGSPTFGSFLSESNTNHPKVGSGGDLPPTEIGRTVVHEGSEQ